MRPLLFLTSTLLVLSLVLHPKSGTAETLTIGYANASFSDDFMLSDDAEHGVQGTYVDWAIMAAKQCHMSLDWKAMPIKRGLFEMDKGRLDAWMLLGNLPSRSGRFLFSDRALVVDDVVMISAKRRNLDFTRLTDLKNGDVVAVIRGFDYEHLKDDMQHVHIRELSNGFGFVLAVMQMFLVDRIDYVMIASRMAVETNIRGLDLADSIRVHEQAVEKRSFHLGLSLSEKSRRFKACFDQVARQQATQ